MKPYSVRPKDLEKYSSAVTLSDMEIFVFPELLYALLLANLMSPRIWKWRDDPWFAKMDTMSPQKKINRLKQYIIDHYEFNLDLDTWGLTDQQTELDRFDPFMDAQTISRSNALFGYQGDQHYFDLDIRRHFGLEKYDDTVIPYWKTETVEAMDAFARRDGYRVGAGECVSLSTLYAAALFILCNIPLENIFLMATPLHSQNFIAVNDGLLTNNRRIVTKNMWFNGTELSDKAQRALRNEQITMVFNNTGYVHCIYPEATMDPIHYERFKKKIGDYLSSHITFEILANFLRQHSRFQKYFQICYKFHDQKQWIAAERVYAYEHGISYKVGDKTRRQLLEEIDREEFYSTPLPDRICLSHLENFLKNDPIRPVDIKRMTEFGKKLSCAKQKNEILAALLKFVHLKPTFPPMEKKRSNQWKKLEIAPGTTRGELISYIELMRSENPAADLAFYAARDMSRCDWTPFLKASFERNPVCIKASRHLSDDELLRTLEKMDLDSIYDESRLAQPDEVWNFQTGDGLEKAILLSTIFKHRYPNERSKLIVKPDRAKLKTLSHSLTFISNKGLSQS